MKPSSGEKAPLPMFRSEGGGQPNDLGHFMSAFAELVASLAADKTVDKLPPCGAISVWNISFKRWNANFVRHLRTQQTPLSEGIL